MTSLHQKAPSKHTQNNLGFQNLPRNLKKRDLHSLFEAEDTFLGRKKKGTALRKEGSLLILLLFCIIEDKTVQQGLSGLRHKDVKNLCHVKQGNNYSVIEENKAAVS